MNHVANIFQISVSQTRAFVLVAMCCLHSEHLRVDFGGSGVFPNLMPVAPCERGILCLPEWNLPWAPLDGVPLGSHK